MAKRFTMRNDLYLHQFSLVGLPLMARDLGRSEASIRTRIKKLKDSGAWDAMTQLSLWEKRYRLALNLPCWGGWEELDETTAKEAA